MEDVLTVEMIVELANILLPTYRPAFFPNMTYAEKRPYINEIERLFHTMENAIARERMIHMLESGLRPEPEPDPRVPDPDDHLDDLESDGEAEVHMLSAVDLNDDYDNGGDQEDEV